MCAFFNFEAYLTRRACVGPYLQDSVEWSRLDLKPFVSLRYRQFHLLTKDHMFLWQPRSLMNGRGLVGAGTQQWSVLTDQLYQTRRSVSLTDLPPH